MQQKLSQKIFHQKFGTYMTHPSRKG